MVKIKRYLLPKQVENSVDSHHGSDRDEESHIESKQISLTIMVSIKWHLLPKQVENRVDLHHDSDRGEECYIESNKYHKHYR